MRFAHEFQDWELSFESSSDVDGANDKLRALAFTASSTRSFFRSSFVTACRSSSLPAESLSEHPFDVLGDHLR